MWNALQDRDSAEVLGHRQRWLRVGTLVLALTGTFLIGFLFGMVHLHGKVHNLPVPSLLHSCSCSSRRRGFGSSPGCSDLHGGRNL